MMFRARWLMAVLMVLGLGVTSPAPAGAAESICSGVIHDVSTLTPQGVEAKSWGPGDEMVVELRGYLSGAGPDWPEACEPHQSEVTFDVTVALRGCGEVTTQTGAGTVTTTNSVPGTLLAQMPFTVPDVCPPGSQYNVGEPVERGNAYVYSELTRSDGSAGGNIEIFFFVRGGASKPFPPGLAYGLQGVVGQQADPVLSSTGAFAHTESDFTMPVRGGNLDAWRVYNSNTASDRGLGPGWSHSFGDSLTIEPESLVTWTNSHGAQIEFRYSYGTNWAAPFANASRLTQNTDDTFTVTTDDRWQLKFDAAGALTSMTDRNGRVIAVSRDASDRVSEVSSSSRKLVYAYQPDGKLATVTAHGGGGAESATVSYGYTGGRLTRVDRPGGESVVYSYDAEGRLATIKDAEATVPQLTNVYGVDGRVVSQTDGTGHTTTWAWDPSSNTSTMTDARGGEWKDVYQNGWLITRVDPTGVTTTYDWNDSGTLFRVTNTTGESTRFEYDSFGHVTSRLDATGAKETYQYDWNQSEPKKSTDALGRSTSFTYDAQRNLTKAVLPLANTAVEMAYASDTRDLVSVSDAEEKTWTLESDPLTGDLVGSSDPLSAETAIESDAFGRIERITPPAGSINGTADWDTTFSRDPAGRVTEIETWPANTSSVTYDSRGRVSTTTDGLANTTTYTYDNADHLVSIDPPGSSVPATSMTYDESGNLATSTDGRGVVTSYQYDAANRVAAVTTAGSTWAFTYDSNGRRRTIEAPSGRMTTLTWDARSLLTKVDYSDDTPDVEFSYDAGGRRASMTDGAGTATYTYDALDRLTKIERGDDVWQYSWDRNGRLTSRTAPHQAASLYTYDDTGRLTSVSRDGVTVASYTYDVAGDSMTRTQANGVITEQQFDPAGRVASIEERDSGGAILSSETYERDIRGNPTKITYADGTSVAQVFDELNRLTEVCYNTATCDGASDYIRYTYDANHHIETETRPAGTTTFTYDDLDQLVSKSGPDGTFNYTYDADGNRLTGDGKTQTVNAAGQVTSETVAGATTTYAYDGNGQLKSSMTDGAETTFDFDPVSAQLVAERQGSTVLRSYHYGRELVGQTVGADTSYYSTNELGSVTAVRSESAATERTYQYEPYGAMRAETSVPNAPSNALLFTGGRSADGGATYRFGFRTYGTASQSFTTPDQGGSGDTYGYASANPAVFTDQLGLYSVRDFLGDVNKVSGWIATGATAVAVGCTAVVICAPAVPVAGTIAATGAAVNALSGAGIAYETCRGDKGSCAGAVTIAAVGLLGSRFGGGRLTTQASTGTARAANDYVDLASPSRRSHILGGHRYGGEHGNTWFPEGWSDDQIMHAISDIATDPSLTWVQQTGRAGAAFTRGGAPVRYTVEGVRDGTSIRVVLEPGGEGIITGFPIR